MQSNKSSTCWLTDCRRLEKLSLAVIALFALEQYGSAQTVFFDTSSTTGLQNGAGIWDTGTTADWNTSSSGANAPVVWADDDLATFGTPTNPTVVANTVTIGSGVTIKATGVTVTSSLSPTTITGGTIQMDGSTGFTQSSGSGSLTINSNLLLNVGSSVAFGGSASGPLTVNGNISGIVGTIARITGPNVTFTGTNSFAGGIQENAGANLAVTQAAGLGSAPTIAFHPGVSGATTTLQMNFASDGNVGSKWLFDVAGTTPSVTIASNGTGAANLSNTAAITFGALAGGNSATGSITLSFGGTSTAANVFAGQIVDSGTGTNITSVAKQGAGMWSLTGSNVYSGNTQVNAGTLLAKNIAGSATGKGSVLVANGATFGGSGSIKPVGSNTLTISAGGILAPGTAGNTDALTVDASSNTTPGMINLSGATLDFNLGAFNTASKLNLTSAFANEVTGLSSNTFNFTDLTSGSLSAGVYTLIQTDSAVNPFDSSLGSYTLNGLSAYTGFTEQLQETLVNGDYVLQLDINAVPEPSAWALMLSGIGALAYWQRRRESREVV